MLFEYGILGLFHHLAHYHLCICISKFPSVDSKIIVTSIVEKLAPKVSSLLMGV